MIRKIAARGAHAQARQCRDRLTPGTLAPRVESMRRNAFTGRVVTYPETSGAAVGTMQAMRSGPSESSHLRESVTGLILAGGLARRMGGEDKGLVSLAGRPMVAHVLEALQPQVGSMLLNANRNRERYAALGHPVLADASGGFQGPLAGMLTGLKHCSTEFLVTVPCDAPLLAPDLVGRLHTACAAAGADLAVASDGERRQPVFLLLRASLASSLEAYLAGGGRAAHAWVRQSRAAVADFSDQPDIFLNVNDPDERQRIEALLISRTVLRPVACATSGQTSR